MGIVEIRVVCWVSSCNYYDYLMRARRQLRIYCLVMDKIASSQAHGDVCESCMHCVIVVPKIARSLCVIISVDLYVVFLVRIKDEISRDIIAEE